jgi:colanic acid/amylovoran biosynthesis glycosyltransferase
MARQVVALGCPEQKIRVLRIGVDLSAIPYAPRSWTPGTPLHVLMASSFRPKKGIPVALRALAALKETLRITIVGDSAGDAGSEREKKLIYRTAHETGLAEKIDWLGFRSHKELLPIAQGAHLFLHPSMQASSGDNEGGAPVILTEIAASGMPIVSTRHCDIPEVIIDGETGYLARENDAYHLTACLKKWIDEPGAWSKRLAAGRRHIEEHFDLVKQAGKLETIYKSLLTNGH